LLKYLREVSDSPPNHEWLKVKSAIWAAANIALCHEGVLVIEREGSINAIINIAEKSQVYSLRGTAFYALGLVATTRYATRVYSKCVSFLFDCRCQFHQHFTSSFLHEGVVYFAAFLLFLFVFLIFVKSINEILVQLTLNIKLACKKYLVWS